MRLPACMLALLVVAGLAILAVREWPQGLPWQPRCSVTGPGGQVLVVGAPAEVATRIADASGQVARALAAGPALNCRIAPIPATDAAKESPMGLTPRAQRLREQVRAQFGAVPDGGYGPQPTLPGRRPGGEHSLGRAIDFFFRPHEDPEQFARGWALANWAVANAERLGIRTVIHRDRIWSARRSGQGWREYRFPGANPDSPVNRHLDHVHIDVG